MEKEGSSRRNRPKTWVRLVMSYRVEFKQKAVTDLDSLTKIFQERILKKIKWLSENFNEITPQALSVNLTGLFKLRVGDYRVIYSVDKNTE